MKLDVLVQNINCYSEFHTSCKAIIRQLSKGTVTVKDMEKTKQNIVGVALLIANYTVILGSHYNSKNGVKILGTG